MDWSVPPARVLVSIEPSSGRHTVDRTQRRADPNPWVLSGHDLRTQEPLSQQPPLLPEERGRDEGFGDRF